MEAILLVGLAMRNGALAPFHHIIFAAKGKSASEGLIGVVGLRATGTAMLDDVPDNARRGQD
ncbi:MAG: hypothetical protein WCA44_01375 [Acidobacteriaceae bacterium]